MVTISESFHCCGNDPVVHARWMNELMQAPDKVVSSMLEDLCSTSVTTGGFIILQPFNRVRAEIWLWFPDFSRTKLLLFPGFSRHFVHLYVNKKITKLAFKRWNFLYNVFFYSQYRMGLKFWTLNFRCFVSWTARKLTNASVINSVTDICIFQVSITVIKDFSRLFHTYDQFLGFSRPWKVLN